MRKVKMEQCHGGDNVRKFFVVRVINNGSYYYLIIRLGILFICKLLMK